MNVETCVRFYIHEGSRHGGRPLREWLFEMAGACGIPGGTAYRASAGFGRHGLHEDHFFELAGELPEAIEFFASNQQVEALLATAAQAGLKLLYITYVVNVGVTGQ